MRESMQEGIVVATRRLAYTVRFNEARCPAYIGGFSSSSVRRNLRGGGWRGVWAVRRAVFLDRDGTLIELEHYLTDPGDVRLEAGAGAAMGELQRLDYALVVVTNQSIIGRGMLTVAGLEKVHAELARQLAAFDVRLDGIYHCPFEPLQKDQTVVEHPDRKPGPGMLLRACRELDLEVSASWMIGDSVSDVLAGRNAGCKGSILVRTGYGDRVDAEAHGFSHVANDISEAVDKLIELDGESTE